MNENIVDTSVPIRRGKVAVGPNTKLINAARIAAIMLSPAPAQNWETTPEARLAIVRPEELR